MTDQGLQFIQPGTNVTSVRTGRLKKKPVLLCLCGHDERLHRLDFMAPCVGLYENGSTDMGKWVLCSCKGWSVKK